MSCYVIYHYNILDKEKIELLGPLSMPIVEKFGGEIGSVELSRLFLQRIVRYLYKAEPLSCGCSGQCAPALSNKLHRVASHKKAIT